MTRSLGQYQLRGDTQYELTNEGESPCVVSGAPVVSVRTEAGTVARAAGTGPSSKVLLAPGQSATFLLSSIASLDNPCAPTYGRNNGTIRVSLPGQSATIRQPYGGIACELEVGSMQRSGPGSTSVALPGVIDECNQADPTGVASPVEPNAIIVACADANLRLDHLVWNSWGTTHATGVGDVDENDCIPFCAAGKFHQYPVRITLSLPVNSAIGPLFSQAAVQYQGPGPQGQTSQHIALPLPPD
jgi:hypothetical protein